MIMRTQKVRLALFAFLLVLLVGWAAVPAWSQSDPESVAKALIAAEDSNNVDSAAALFAENAVVTLADGSKYDTPDGVRGWQQELADGHFRLEPVNMQVDGSTVTWTGTISLDVFRSLGIASLGGTWTLDIEGGKIEKFDFQFTPEAVTALTAGGVVMSLTNAEAQHDVDAASALFAENAVVTLADGSKYDTPDGVRGWQQELADGHFHLEPVARYVHGNVVTMYGDIGLDAFRGLGIPAMGGVWNVTVDGGKITAFDFQFTPEAMAALQSAIAAMSATPEATASQ
jgi:hypothetical protein